MSDDCLKNIQGKILKFESKIKGLIYSGIFRPSDRIKKLEQTITDLEAIGGIG